MRVILCHCVHAGLTERAKLALVAGSVAAAGHERVDVGDLCELAARKDARLAEWLASEPVTIVACYPRAVAGLLASANVAPPLSLKLANLRAQPAEAVLAELGVAPGAPAEAPPMKKGTWPAWFPVIDRARCTGCKQCMAFCLFGVYALAEGAAGGSVLAAQAVQVKQPDRCKNNCPACARVCPASAIMFPKYAGPPINGDAVRTEDVQRERMQMDLAALRHADIYAQLRQRQAEATPPAAQEPPRE